MFRISDLEFLIFKKGGYAAITAMLIVLTASLVIVGGLTFFALWEVAAGRLFTDSLKAKYAAEGGVEDIIYRLVTKKQTGGTDTLTLGTGTATVSVTASDSNRFVHSDGAAGAAMQKIEVFVDMSSTNISFLFGAYVGTGGVEMGNNSIIQGSVFSNGPITGLGGTIISGDAFASGTYDISEVTVNGNAQAYRISNNTVGGNATSSTLIDNVIVGRSAYANELKNSSVARDAYYQIIDSQTTVGGVKYPGSPAPNPLTAIPSPVTDAVISKWQQEAQELGVVAAGDCSQNWSPPSNPYTINGGVIQSNLVLDNNQVLYMKGTLWVKCNTTVSNGAGVKLDSSYGADSGILLSDGWIDLQNNGEFAGSGTPGSFVMLITPALGGGPNGSAINISNNATGVIFNALNGTIYVGHGVTVNELNGKKIHLENNAILIYESGLQSVNFVSPPTIRYWKEVE